MECEILGAICLMAVPAGILNLTITRGKLLAGFRLRYGGPFKCPYCLMHWLAIPAALASPPRWALVAWGITLVIGLATGAACVFFTTVIGESTD